MTELARTAAQMVAPGKGILAADESIATMSARLEKTGVAPTEENRRAYRELLVTTPRLASGISGVILCDETFRQSLADGRTFPEAMAQLGLLPGIKVDTGARHLAGAPGETVTEGLDGLRERLAEYAALGARFAKWRAVVGIGAGTGTGAGQPSPWKVRADAHALARYAALCQEAGIVPIVEPEVLMEGAHGTARCAAVTSEVLRAVFAELEAAGVDLEGIVLKPNMVVPGRDSFEVVTPDEVARATVTVLRAAVDERVAGIAFLSGGQSAARATAHLAAMQRLETPWPLTFSFGRGLVDPALAAWHGEPGRVSAGQRALAHRVACNTAALQGTYTDALEDAHAPA
ncbi:class I fructose-bisphosphate aldolase [Streptomyces sp. V3I7]|uniref:class I fructose-bisphosphate aldolase n=1 Tax=Streptomyces sp. V3I7 TaxID=3042278 RepID=UPI002783C694|nr:class I fructose-bisphosphate aldolase [Streptomyces sp. V3I7]MDQ0994264.1 fructose-bisphosphate aldolase class I [Streptomyces sp. V3I7]